MFRDVAVLKGKTALYSYLYGGKVLIMKDNYKHMTISRENFELMFVRLTESIAALKEDCIQYVVYHPYSPLLAYPKWYIQAHHDGSMYEEYFGTSMFIDDTGEVLMSPGSVVLMNTYGHLRYMERSDFDKYYETPGGILDEC